jgi:ORF6N domain-containing protein
MPKKALRPAEVLPVRNEMIERRIYFIRGHKVMLDADLADLYQVPTKVFNQAVRRNKARFPADFMFRLKAKEADILRSQIVTSSWGGRRYAPYAFTEQGVAMLSAVLHSDRAIKTSIAIVRVFVRLREMLAGHKELAHQMAELERNQKEQEAHIATIYEMLQDLMTPQAPAGRRIGFVNGDQNGN